MSCIEYKNLIQKVDLPKLLSWNYRNNEYASSTLVKMNGRG